MPSPRRPSTTRALRAVAVAALALAHTGTPDPVRASPSLERSGAAWKWPVAGWHAIARGYEAPASRYSAGHRGVDIAAATGAEVVAPQPGVIRFAGVVVDRGTVTVATRDGVLISIEPVAAERTTGDAVAEGERLGVVSRGGHCDGSCVHLGVRVHGEYVSPLRFFGGVPRAVLLPLR